MAGNVDLDAERGEGRHGAGRAGPGDEVVVDDGGVSAAFSISISGRDARSASATVVRAEAQRGENGTKLGMRIERIVGGAFMHRLERHASTADRWSPPVRAAPTGLVSIS